MGVETGEQERELISRKCQIIQSKMRRISVERVVPTNVAKLRELNQKIFPILSVTEMSDNFYQAFTKDTGFAFLAFHDKALAGSVCCQQVGENSLYLRFIGTISRHRRKGVGKAMMGQVMKEAMARDMDSVYAYVRRDNKAAIHLNRKFGLVITGTCRQDENLVVMEKIFD